MGFFKGVGRVGMGVVNNVGRASIGAGVVARETIGKTVTNAAFASPAKFATAIVVGAMAGSIASDISGEDTGDGAKVGMIGAAGIASTTGVLNGTIGKVAGAGVAKGIAGAGAGAIGTLGAAAVGAAGTAVAAAGGLGAAMIKMPTGPVGIGNLSDIKIRKSVALPVMAVAGLIGGTGKAYNAYEKSRMGTHDGMMRTSTPVVPVQQSGGYDNGGATGDLVFAMRNNR